LAWEDKHLVLRAAEHQQPWYLKLNRRAVVPTLVHDGYVVPESNVILEYLEDVFPQLRLRPNDPYNRSKMPLWTKQLNEDVHDACAAILSFGIAFRHQYLERAELGKAMLERIPNIFKRERRSGTGAARRAQASKRASRRGKTRAISSSCLAAARNIGPKCRASWPA